MRYKISVYSFSDVELLSLEDEENSIKLKCNLFVFLSFFLVGFTFFFFFSADDDSLCFTSTESTYQHRHCERFSLIFYWREFVKWSLNCHLIICFEQYFSPNSYGWKACRMLHSKLEHKSTDLQPKALLSMTCYLRGGQIFYFKTPLA